MDWLGKWLDLSLRTKCLLLISFPAAATVAMAGASYLVGAETASATQQLNQKLRIGIEIERLKGSEIEATADVRAFLMTADDPYAARAREALAGFDAAWQSLSDLTADDSSQRLRLAQVAALERSRVERIFGETVQFRSRIPARDDLKTLLEVAETERLDLEQILKGMQETNNGAMAAYLARVTGLRARQNGIMTICVFFGIAGGLIMTVLFAQGITGRIGKLQGNIARLVAGADIHPLPGGDEIGGLNAGLAQVERSMALQRAVLENAPSGIAEVDSQGRYRWLNKAFKEITGLSEDYRPQSLQHTLPAGERSRIQEAIQAVGVGGRTEINVRLDPPSGPATEVEMTVLRPSGLADAGLYIFLKEIGTGAEEHAQIRANDAAAASNRAKNDFLAKISHDIRTPLNAILGAADLLSQTALTFDQSGYVHMFQRNCRRLVALINDFLDFSRIEAGAIRIEKAPFKLREVVGDAVATFREAAARKAIVLGMDIDSGTPEWLVGDPLRIQQVLVNLLSNALKFTVTGRVDVLVKVEETRPESRRLLCEVVDTGPGIAPEDQDQIFVKFIQLPNQTAGQRGTGLGLTICRDLVELMGGEIGVSSHAGGGSNFHFNLPIETAQQSEAELVRPTDSALSSPPRAGTLTSTNAISILVAEDTEDNRLLLEHYLRSEQVELRFAFNGREAVDVVERGDKFDLILMDIDMPVLDGYGASRAIRAWESSHGRSTPIVALSADAMSEAVRSSLEAGCVAHVAKPIDRATLLSTIQRYAKFDDGRASAPVPAATVPPAAAAVAVSPEVLRLVPQYLASKQKQIDEARGCLTARDFGPIRRFGHNLKGTGSGYGFPAIEEFGRTIEKAAMDADADRIAEQLDALHRFVTETEAAVEGPVLQQRSNGS